MIRAAHLHLLLLLLTAPPAAAQQAVPVRSGEHATFTRLVFPASAGLGWTEDGPPGGPVTLAFDDLDLRFDVGTVFDRIPRTRLAGIAASGSELTLDLACACGVSVSQIGSGHVVIDVAEGAEVAMEPGPLPAAPAVLPWQLGPVPTLALGLDGSDAPTGAPEPDPEITIAEPDALPDTPPQIVIRQSGGPTLLPEAAPSEAAQVARAAGCEIEAVAEALLRRDPIAALDELPVLRAALVDDAGQPDPAAHRALARGYLSAGFGAEAAFALADAPGGGDAVLLRIATALDAMPGVEGAADDLDPRCGPATATLALLAGAEPPSTEDVTLLGFLDALPRARRADLDARLGRVPTEPAGPAPEPAALTHAASGTDAEAVTAAVALLAAEDGPPLATRLGNALALRPSVPEGPLRDQLDDALTLRLVAAGHFAEAATLVAGHPERAARTLAEALDVLAPESAAVAAIRLRPALAPEDPVLARAAGMLRGYGLDDLARTFAPPPEGAPDHRADVGSEARAWIARDFAALDPATTRGEVAAYRQQRNAAPVAGGDFDRARDAATRAETLSTLLADLMGPPEG